MGGLVGGVVRCMLPGVLGHDSGSDAVAVMWGRGTIDGCMV
jgi:hypothetical protein